MIFPGFKEKNNTRVKKITEKIRSAVFSEIWFTRSGSMPVVKDVVAHLGIAKQGPMVRYSRQVKKYLLCFPMLGESAF